MYCKAKKKDPEDTEGCVDDMRRCLRDRDVPRDERLQMFQDLMFLTKKEMESISKWEIQHTDSFSHNSYKYCALFWQVLGGFGAFKIGDASSRSFAFIWYGRKQLEFIEYWWSD